jgi:hypothetical protein
VTEASPTIKHINIPAGIHIFTFNFSYENLPNGKSAYFGDLYGAAAFQPGRTYQLEVRVAEAGRTGTVLIQFYEIDKATSKRTRLQSIYDATGIETLLQSEW